MQKILFLEDYEPDAELAMLTLRKAGLEFDFRRVERRAEFLDAVRSWQPDAIIADFLLPELTALDALALLKEAGIDTPLILVTGSQTEEIAVECLKAGAVDYLLKGSLTRLPNAVESAIESHRTLREFARVERLFHEFMLHLPGIAYVTRSDSEYLFVNKAIEEWWNKPANAIVGKRASDLFPEAAAQLIEELNERVLRTGTSVTTIAPFPFSNPDRIRHILLQKFPLASPGQPMLIGNVGIDVTERIDAEHALQASEERYRKVSELVSDVTWDFDVTTNRLNWTDSLRRVFGYDSRASEHTGDWIMARIHPQDLEQVARAYEEVLGRRESRWHTQFRFQRADGVYRFVEVHAAIDYAEDGSPLSVLGAMRDISRRQELEEQLVKAKERAEEMSALKSSFLANMSHEIRTPMNAILGFTEMLQELELAGDAMQYLQIIRRSGERLLATINSILDLASIESDQVRYVLEEVPVIQAVEEVVRLLSPLARSKNLTIMADLPQDLKVQVDSQLFHRVLGNVIGNAIKFTPMGSVRVTARPVQKDANQSVCIDIIDTGIGIKAEHFERIFAVFEQVEHGFGRGFEGTGLGLAISRHLLTLMGGTIEVRSKLGVGSTFSIHLPASRQQIPSQSPEPTSQLVHGPMPLRLPFILLIEDNPETGFLVVSMLRHLAHVTHVLTAEQGLAVLRDSPTGFDMLLLDMNLGAGLSGLDLTRILRNDSRFHDLPIVAVTAFAMNGDREITLEAGCTEYLAKPFTRTQLVEILRKYVPKQQ